MKTLIMLLSMAVLSMQVAACNTMEGAGQDIKAGGQKLENSADKHKNY